MKKKRIIIIIISIVALALLIAGGILIYQEYYNKNKLITSFRELKSSLEDTFNLEQDSLEHVKQTITGTTTFNINPELGNSSDGSDIIISNLNNSTFTYDYRFDEDNKQIYLNGGLNLNNTEVFGINYYQNNDISYIFLRNIFDKYIMIEDNDIFSYLDNSIKTKEDIDYIYDKAIETLGNNITKEDIKVAKENSNKKISLELTEKRLQELSNAIVEELKNDQKVKEILKDDLNNIDITTTNNTTNNNSKISYSIYLNKGNIISYELELNNNGKDYAIAYNTGNEKSIVIKEDQEEIIKATINKANNSINSEISYLGNTFGTINISKNNKNFNFIIDESTNTTLSGNLNSHKSNNIRTTTLNIGIGVGEETEYPLLEVTDIQNITEGENVDFSNIDTSNNINVNSLTETDITTIENNLMTILYNYFGATQ